MASASMAAGETRVSAAALEALAIVAYRQPVTRGVIERIRGVDSDYVIRSLIARRLVVEQGRPDTPGRPILYATSFEFLERFGLASLDELPPLDAEVAARLVVPEAEVEDDEDADEPDQETLGLGTIDIPGFLTELESHDYSGWVTTELSPYADYDPVEGCRINRAYLQSIGR